jgi:hypothetical protein
MLSQEIPLLAFFVTNLKGASMILYGENPQLELAYEYLEKSRSQIEKTLELERSKENHEKLTLEILDLLALFRKVPVSGYEDGAVEMFNKCLTLILDTICDENFGFDRSLGYRMAEYSAMISNIAFSCDVKDTSSYIDKVKNQKDGMYKRIILTSARNSREELEDLSSHYGEDVPLFNNWASNIFQVASAGFIDKRVVDNMDFIASVVVKHDFEWGMSSGDLFNCVTYMQSPYEKELKKHISKCFQKTFSTSKELKLKKTKKIAIYSENWFNGHSTHRTVAKYIHALKGKYELTLLHGERHKQALQAIDTDVDLFTHKHQIAIFGLFDPLELSIVGPSNQDYDVLIFPDAGFDVLSIILANMRIAPVQINMTGFPISIFDSNIDYFISGEDVELESEVHNNYTERCVLLPGFGAVHTRPTYSHDFVEPKKSDKILIGGSWIGPKTHYVLVDALREIFKSVTKECVLRTFPGVSWFHNNKSYKPYVENFIENFDESLTVDIVEGVEQKDYIRLMSEIDCAVDSYPWGGSNTVSDCIHLNKPVITWEGTRWFNRIGSAMIRSIGLGELVATSTNDYIEKSIKLIEDDTWRIEMTNRIHEANKTGLVDRKIYNHDKGKDAFLKFIDDCVEGKIPPGRAPIKFN